jgi:hypothetical protein
VIGRIAAVLVACVCASGIAWAQEDQATPAPRATGEPASLAIAVGGVVLASAGFGLMLRTTGPCYCEPRTAWVIGGVAIVAAGVTMTWLGLRSRTVTIAPDLGPHVVGGRALIRWGGGSPR